MTMPAAATTINPPAPPAPVVVAAPPVPVAVPPAAPVVAPPPVVVAPVAPPAPVVPAVAADPTKSPWDTPPVPATVTPPAEPSKAADGVKAPAAVVAEPAKFELTVPEGFTMEPAKLTAFTEEAKSLGLNPEQAKKLLTRDLSAQKAQADHVASQMKTTDAGWLGQLQKEWGDKFVERAELVKRGFEDFDPDGSIRAGMKAAGLTNWPQVVKAMERHGQRIKEDKFINAQAGKTDPEQNMTPEEKLAAQYRRNAKK